MIAYETDLASTIDPFAGSYVIESMTDAVEQQAADVIGQIDERGGAVAAIEQGFQKAEIERSAYQVAREVDAGTRVVVGVNRFRAESEEPYQPLRVDPAIEREQVDRLARLRRTRDSDAHQRALDVLKKAANGTENLLYPLRAALQARATVGEVCDALRDVWGVYTPPDVS